MKEKKIEAKNRKQAEKNRQTKRKGWRRSDVGFEEDISDSVVEEVQPRRKGTTQEFILWNRKGSRGEVDRKGEED